MKTNALILMLVTLANLAIAQQPGKTVTIDDVRKAGIAKYDTSTEGRQNGDVYVARILTSKSHKSTTDLINAYEIHFFRPFDNKLKNYQMTLVGEEDFDNVTYSWETDSIVSVTLVNAATKKTRKVRLVQLADRNSSAGMIDERFEQEKTEATLLYNHERQFRSDTTLIISADQFKIWKYVEDSVLNLLSERLVANLKEEVPANNIPKRNVFSFVVESGKIKQVSQAKYVSGENPNEGAIKRIKSHEKEILKAFNYANKEYYNGTIQFSGTYYISL